MLPDYRIRTAPAVVSSLCVYTAELGLVVARHGLNQHHYADATIGGPLESSLYLQVVISILPTGLIPILVRIFVKFRVNHINHMF